MKLCYPLIFDTSKVLDGTVIILLPFLDQALLNADHTCNLIQPKKLHYLNLLQSILSSINQIIIYLVQLWCLQMLKSLQK